MYSFLSVLITNHNTNFRSSSGPFHSTSPTRSSISSGLIMLNSSIYYSYLYFELFRLKNKQVHWKVIMLVFQA